ncbi:MAG: O-antigen ligase family protein, partial [Patescibacteria group bacterium]|nr:O-antigen ligase family protein [Patescibacteria group bacterium]
MPNLNKFRWPYREDAVFSLLAFAVLLVPLAFSVFTNENFETIKLVLWLLCLGSALLIWLFRRFREGLKIFGRAGRLMLYSAAGFLLWALLASLWAPDRLYAFFGFYYRFTNGVLFYALFVFTLVLLTQVLDWDRWRFLVKILVIDGFAVAVKGILESLGLTLYQGLSTEAVIRSPGLLGNPNFSAMFLACVLPLSVLLALAARRFWPRVALWLNVFVVFVALITYSSRGAFLAVIVSAIFTGLALLFLRLPKRQVILALIITIAVVFGSFWLLGISRPGIFGSRGDVNIDTRLAVWRQTWQQAIWKHPAFGVGPGNFAVFHERVARDPLMGVFDDPHNLWLLLAATGGLPLLLLFLSIIGWPAWTAYRKLQIKFDGYLLAGLASLIAFIVAAAFTPVPIPTFLLLAVLLSGFLLSEGNVHILKLRVIFRAILAALAFILVACGLCLGAGETLLYLGHLRYQEGNFSSAKRLLAWSQAVNPTGELARVFYAYADLNLGADTDAIRAEA